MKSRLVNSGPDIDVEAPAHELGQVRLERACIQLLTPEMFRSERGLQFSARIDEIRRELGRALPEEPSAFARKVRRSIERDIAREVYRALDIPPENQWR
jgi:hypothetical protein